MKRIILILICIALLFAIYGESTVKKQLKSYLNIGSESQGLYTRNQELGSNNSFLKVKVIGISGSKISNNFITALVKQFSALLEENKAHISVEYLGSGVERKFTDVLNEETLANKSKLLILAPDVILATTSKDLINEKGILTILFSSDEDVVCSKNMLSPYIWNFGIPLSSSVETYLSFINQKYGKLAKDLRIFIYQNDTPALAKQEKTIADAITGLGLKFVGTLVVDERFDNLYPTARQIFDYDPKVVLGLGTRKGANAFIPTAAKLNLTFDIGLSFLEGVYEEDLIDHGNSARGILLLASYIQNHTDKVATKLITNSMYQGYLVSGIIEKLFFRGFNKENNELNLSQAFENLDGAQYHGLAGLVTIDKSTHGLIQPLSVGEFKDGRLNQLQNLGDISLSPEQICVGQ